MEQGSLPFTSNLARLTRTRSKEIVVAVPLPPPNQAEMDELRMQSVERAAITSSHLNQMTYEQLAQFYAQQEAMAKRMEDESSRQFAMAKAMEKNRLELEESRAILLRQEEQVRQQNELKRAMAEQTRVSEAHQEMLRQPSDAMRQQNYKVEDLNQMVRRDSERWGLFAEATTQLSPFPSEQRRQQSAWRTSWVCNSEDHKVLKCPKCQPGEAQRLLDQRFKKPHVATVAAPDKKTDKKTKFIGAAVAANDVVEARAHRTLDCDINGLKATTLLDKMGNFTSPVRQLDDAMELGGFMKGMKLDVDRDVKLRLTYDTAEGTLMIASLKFWVAVAPLQDGLGDLIVSRHVMAKLGYCPRSLVLNARRAQSVYDLDQLGGKDTPLMAAMKVVEAMEKLHHHLKKRRCITTKNKHVFLK
ncbi:hypothetical protein DYB28_005045 [Aphanomyces astaci]|uniref:Uncharacterized protein n=1 Tax=Aphanomyces astaci TaxID=112090 RepID=A0A9X8DUY2_APHAT|nr:hypothetical protein DYB28_005045 [Aphanomyces astaci]